jgi:hypothetical protein
MKQNGCKKTSVNECLNGHLTDIALLEKGVTSGVKFIIVIL